MIEITAENVDKLNKYGQGTCLIDFYSKSCAPCRKMMPILEEVETELNNENIGFVKICVDDFMYLAETFNITTLPTIVVVKNGHERTRCSGITAKSAILGAIGENL